ncbi:GNAT family N-acetyltransferase [Streptomyces sp. NBC_00102]|uniref:GNAT family N-acetyltransferase n=1 Tax=Streptomyces sp. NBC_00102 TaxID=2975652 RepID=UPI00224E9C69|nr:GNAT family N-acetyltransferase [Streptomyces sp. NBC_00102]MCX5401601.1 GNAT family N-acetyltransferase [Streptomyces sp. NBC_00102]
MSDISTRWYRPGAIPRAEVHELTEMFTEVADEFVPPLTLRGGTAVTDLRERAPDAPDAPDPGNDYLEEMLRQDLVMARHEGRAAGFVSFRSNHQDPRFADLCPCLYVSTIAVRDRYRRHGIARVLYQELFALPESLPPWIVLRTWSTNTGHLGLLDSLGFATVLRIADDRAAGVDTLYLTIDRTARAADAQAPRGTPVRGSAQ